MNFVKLIPVFFSAALIAAHFLRARTIPAPLSPYLVTFSLLFPMLLLAKRAWAARTVQIILIAATAEWLRTLYMIAALRHIEGAPWARLTVIMGIVTATTALSALILQCKSLKERYGHGKRPDGDQEPEKTESTG